MESTTNKYWIIRSPFKTRTWDDILYKQEFVLYGIRSYAARKNISRMTVGDLALWYSKQDKKNYGVLEVTSEPYQDPTSEKDWLAIKLKPVKTFRLPITLAQIKNNQLLKNSLFIRQPRITVVPLTKAEFDEILNLSENEEKK